MAIEIICKLKRKGGTKADFNGKTYHFKPESGDGTDEEVKHSCIFQDEDAVAIYKFLSIKSAYELADPDAELPARPREASGQTMAADKANGGTQEVKPIVVSDGENTYTLTEMEKEDLAALAKNTFGISVHHKWSEQTIIAKIIEKTRDES